MKKTKSIVTGDTYACYFCGMPADCEHHLIFGNGLRDLAEEDGLKVPVCDKCHTIGTLSGRIHDNSAAEKLSKMLGQAIYEKRVGTREQFMKRYGRSYL